MMVATAAGSVRGLRWPRTMILGTLAGLVLGVLGPFGSYLDDGILTRSAYWVGSTWLGLVLYGGGVATVGKLADTSEWQHRGLLMLIVVVASVPETTLTRMAAFLIWPRLHAHDPGWWLWYVQAATIGIIAVTGIDLLSDARERRAIQPPPHPLPIAPCHARVAAKADRPARIANDVIALQMEDHYVRVHTHNGSTLVHMPLNQAITRFATAEGLRTHRSWWVARHAVGQVDGSPRAMRLQLLNGLSVPVARSAVTTLREAGWLPRQGVT